MQQRFIDLWTRIHGKENPVVIFNNLSSLYSEEHRHYHTSVHISNCLNELDSVKHLAQDIDSLEFALWYHDVIYNPERKDNELKSAELALGICYKNDLSIEFSSKMYQLIMKTSNHESANGIDEELMLDIDLSILGKNEEAYRAFEKQIRQEYIWVPNDKYVKGRKDILAGFLNRDRLYITDVFNERYDSIARRNLKWAIKELKLMK